MKCAACGATNPAGAEWCSLCFARFGAPADDAVEHGAVAPRLDGARPFVRTRSTLLVPRPHHEVLEYVEPGGDVQAVVRVQHLLDGGGDRYTCFDTDDMPLFYVERYGAVDEPAFSVFLPNGLPLATVLLESSGPGVVAEVRDGSAAPLATLRSGPDRLDLVETGARSLGFCWREDVVCGAAYEDQWGLTVLEEPEGFDRLAMVALPLTCRLLFTRSGPHAGLLAAAHAEP